MMTALFLQVALSMVAQEAGRVPPDMRCGLGREFHGGRRAALAAALEKGMVLMRGLGPTRGYTRFHQDKAFWYLTGIESPGAALVMDLDRKRELLFLPKRNAGLEAWDGEIWDAEDAWVPELSGFTEIRPIDDLMAFLDERTEEGSLVWISKQPHIELSGCHDRAIPADRRQAADPLDGRVSREEALATNLKERFKVEVRDLSRELSKLRRIKQPEENPGAAARLRNRVAGDDRGHPIEQARLGRVAARRPDELRASPRGIRRRCLSGHHRRRTQRVDPALLGGFAPHAGGRDAADRLCAGV